MQLASKHIGISLATFLFFNTSICFSQNTSDGLVDQICKCLALSDNSKELDMNCFIVRYDELSRPIIDSIKEHYKNRMELDSMVFGLVTAEAIYPKIISRSDIYYQYAMNNDQIEGLAFPQTLKTSRSIDDLNSIIDSGHDLIETYCERGIYHYSNYETDLAFSDVYYAASLDSLNYYPHCLLGKMHLELDQLKEAAKEYTVAYELAQITDQPMMTRNPLAILCALLNRTLAEKNNDQNSDN